MFAWLYLGSNRSRIGRFQRKNFLLPGLAITQPRLNEIGITEELRTCYLARVIDQAALLELSEAGKKPSVRLRFAIDAYGPYDEESFCRTS